jgi:hypothetical protein
MITSSRQRLKTTDLAAARKEENLWSLFAHNDFLILYGIFQRPSFDSLVDTGILLFESNQTNVIALVADPRSGSDR